jgi:uncharacterized protein YbbC (DUF1343 family)
MKLKHLLWLAILLSGLTGVDAQVFPGLKQATVLCGADRMDQYAGRIAGKNIGLVANPTSRVGRVHLVDTLVCSGIRVKRVFAPEHGFRGEEEAGATISDGQDPVTGVPVVSLYGNHKKPTPADLAGIDLVIFDIQDVGVRFYTYISTLHLVMEACASQGIPVLVLDRPNPNGFYIDGPVLDTAFRSFVGMDPVPVVHGMTIGEYAMMINGEHWLEKGLQCDLTVIPCSGYDHQTEYVLPVKPSPNLPNQVSVYLYPTLCFFEGSVVSIGRGTEFPFQVYGHPGLKGDFVFTPHPVPGVSLHPPLENQPCRGRDLRIGGIRELSGRPGLRLEWLIDAYKSLNTGDKFFTGYFDTLAGSGRLRSQIREGASPDDIRKSWKEGLHRFQGVRAKYLLYPDSELCRGM